MRGGRSRSAPRRVVAALLALCSTACYAYRPVEEGSRPDAGAEVRVDLEPAAASDLERRTGRDRSSLEGLVVEAGSDSLALSVAPLGPRGTDPYGLRRDTVRFSYDGLAGVQRKQLRTGQTLLLVGGLVAAAGALGFALIEGSGGGGGGTGDGGDGGNLDLRGFRVPIP